MGVLIIRTIIFLGLYWGSPILGNHHLGFMGCRVCSTKPEALNPMPSLGPKARSLVLSQAFLNATPTQGPTPYKSSLGFGVAFKKQPMNGSLMIYIYICAFYIYIYIYVSDFPHSLQLVVVISVYVDIRYAINIFYIGSTVAYTKCLS